MMKIHDVCKDAFLKTFGARRLLYQNRIAQNLISAFTSIKHYLFYNIITIHLIFSKKP